MLISDDKVIEMEKSIVGKFVEFAGHLLKLTISFIDWKLWRTTDQLSKSILISWLLRQKGESQKCEYFKMSLLMIPHGRL